MKLNKWLCALVLALVLCMVGSVAMAATIQFPGDGTYTTLQAAVNAAGNNGKVEFTASTGGNGVVFGSDTQNVTIDFKGYTYTFKGTPVGSTGTETNGFQVLKECGSLTLKNGTLNVTNQAFKRIIQSYAMMTVEDMVIDGRGMGQSLNSADEPIIGIAASFNNNQVTITGNTTIYARNNDEYAFDAYDYSDGGYTNDAAVTVDITGTIHGMVDAGGDDTNGKIELAIVNGTFEGEITKSENATIEIEAGTFLGEAACENVSGDNAWTPWAKSDIDLYDSNNDLKGCIIGNSAQLSAALQEHAKAGDIVNVFGTTHSISKLENVPNGVTVTNCSEVSISVNGQVLKPLEFVYDENGEIIGVVDGCTIVVGAFAPVYSAPHTGDNSNVMLWAGMMLVAVLGMVVVSKKRVAER